MKLNVFLMDLTVQGEFSVLMVISSPSPSLACEERSPQVSFAPTGSKVTLWAHLVAICPCSCGSLLTSQPSLLFTNQLLLKTILIKKKKRSGNQQSLIEDIFFTAPFVWSCRGHWVYKTHSLPSRNCNAIGTICCNKPIKVRHIKKAIQVT